MRYSYSIFSPLFFLLVISALQAQAPASDWTTRFDLPGTLGDAETSTIDGNGNLYLQGDFYGANGIVSKTRLLQWDGRRWKSPGNVKDTLIVEGITLQLSDWERPMISIGNTIYLVADNFEPISSPSYREYIISWNGESWKRVGEGFHGTISSIAAHGHDIYVGGDFDTVGTTEVKNIARWDGSRWSEVGGGTDKHVSSLSVAPNGILYISGVFSQAGTAPATKTAEWNGTAWQAIANGELADSPYGMKRMVASNGILYGIDGDRNPYQLYKVEGNKWVRMNVPLDPDLSLSPTILTLDNIGRLYAALYTRESSSLYYQLVQLSGDAWNKLPGKFNGAMNAISVAPDGSLTVSGSFNLIGDSLIVNHAARWDGTQWSAYASDGVVNEGLSGTVNAVEWSNGYCYFGGANLQSVQTPGPHGILRWSKDTGWEEVGEGINGTVQEIVRGTNGDLYVGGCFTTAGNVSARNITRWDGRVWHSVGNGLDICPNDIALAHDTVYAVSDSILFRWDGRSWRELSSLSSGKFYTVAAGENGSVYVGGTFVFVGGIRVNHIAHWKDGTWSSLDSGISLNDPPLVEDAPNTPSVLTVEFDGTYLYAGGIFDRAGGTPAFNIARWGGKEWLPMDSGLVGIYPTPIFLNDRAVVYSIRAHNGSVYAGGRFYGAGSWSLFSNEPSPHYMTTRGGVARWDEKSGTWNPVIESPTYYFPYQVNDIAVNDKDLCIGGNFSFAEKDNLSYTIAGITLPSSYYANRPKADKELDFGISPVYRFVDRDLVITNPTTSNRTLVGEVEIVGEAFSLTKEAGFRVVPGSSVRFPIRFAPASTGPATGTAIIHHNADDDGTPLTVTLRGISIPLQMSYHASPQSVDFGTRLQNSTGDDIEIKVYNHSTSNSTLSIQPEGLAAPFTFVYWGWEKEVKIQPGDSVSLRHKIRLDASMVGDFQQTIVIKHNGELGGHFAIPLHATVVPRVGLLKTTPNSINFGKVPVTQTKADTITLANDSRSNISIDCQVLSTTELPFVVPQHQRNYFRPGESAVGLIRFTPSTVGIFRDTLRIERNIDGKRDTVLIPVRGEGIEQIIPSAQMQLSASEIDFGALMAGETTQKSITITNRVDATDSLIITTAPLVSPFFAAPVQKRVLQPGESSAISISFAPTSEDAFNANLSIEHNVPGIVTPINIPLRGESFTSGVRGEETGAGESLQLRIEPNPSGGQTHIRFFTPTSANASLTIYSLDGRLIDRIINSRIAAGEHTIQWNAQSVESGVYICRLTQGEFTTTRMIVVFGR